MENSYQYYATMKSKKQPAKMSQKRRIAGRDIPLNVSINESLIRFGILILLPILTLLIDKHLMYYVIPICTYLFLTALAQFCIVKYIWHRFVKHDPPVEAPPYGEDPNYPDESI
jgi:hypothetical protein